MPRLTFRLVCLLMVTAIWFARAEEPNRNPWPTIWFGPFPGPFKTGAVRAEPGRADRGPVRPDDPFNLDHPPFVRFGFGHKPDDQGCNDNTLTVYRIDEIDQAPYPTIQPIVKKLRKLLATRRENDPDRMDVPVYPIRNAGRLIQVKTQYFDADWGSGIFFATTYSNGVEEYPENGTLQYLFEGLSKDGRFFVSACFDITHPKLSSPDYRSHLNDASGSVYSPARQANQAAADVATAKAQAFLPRQPDGSFRPSLSKIRQWVGTLTIREP